MRKSARDRSKPVLTTLNRRHLLGAGLALGAAMTAMRASAAEVNSVAGGYAGGPGDVANKAMFPGFRQSFVKTSGATINTLVGGSGPPLLLLHGHPETHVTWHKVAPHLAQQFTVVLTDLRGYGDSSKPEGGDNHSNYSKRAMGNDQVEVMRSLGFPKFQVLAHDRGARVLQRMMLDHPDAITRGAMLDIAPTDKMYAQTDQVFATKYFWWFFHIQPAPLPEKMIDASVETYLKGHLDAQCRTEGAITPECYSEYLRGYRDPACVHAVCEDYRASVTIDMDHMRADNGKKITQPLLAMWGSKGTVGQQFDVLKLWHADADDVKGQALPCGHLVQEEAPEALLAALHPFLVV
jgi:haloacetate dehalogenase